MITDIFANHNRRPLIIAVISLMISEVAWVVHGPVFRFGDQILPLDSVLGAWAMSLPQRDSGREISRSHRS